MGQPKGGGYSKKPTLTGEQNQLQNQWLGQAGNYTGQAAAGYQQFLPGGGGGQALIDQALKRYQQQTIPQIQNSFGTNGKTNSALNQALASSGADMNTDLQAMLAQYQLQAANGLGSLGLGTGSVGLQNPQFAYLQNGMPFWRQALMGGISAGGQALGGYLGRPQFPGQGG